MGDDETFLSPWKWTVPPVGELVSRRDRKTFKGLRGTQETDVSQVVEKVEVDSRQTTGRVVVGDFISL